MFRFFASMRALIRALEANTRSNITMSTAMERLANVLAGLSNVEDGVVGVVDGLTGAIRHLADQIGQQGTPVTEAQLNALADDAEAHKFRLAQSVVKGTGVLTDLEDGDIDDTINGGAGNDTLTGGQGNDLVTLSPTSITGMVGTPISGAFSVDGPNGPYTVAGDGSAVGIVVSSDNSYAGPADRAESGAFDVTATNASGVASAPISVSVSISGADTIDQSGGNDTILGGQGNDQSGWNDTTWGGQGNDTLGGGQWNDSVNTGDGNDTLFGGQGNDSLDTGVGNDSLSTGDGNDSVDTGAGADTLASSSNF